MAVVAYVPTKFDLALALSVDPLSAETRSTLKSDELTFSPALMACAATRTSVRWPVR